LGCCDFGQIYILNLIQTGLYHLRVEVRYLGRLHRTYAVNTRVPRVHNSLLLH
jgi:hypothetical protein